MPKKSKTSFGLSIPPELREKGRGKGKKKVPSPGGRRLRDPSWAWWYLSDRQKQMLTEGRRQGKYGGTPGMPKYWYIQEVGSATGEFTTDVHIPPKRYLAKSTEVAVRLMSKFARTWVAGL